MYYCHNNVVYSFVKLYLKNRKRSSFLSEWAKKKKKLQIQNGSPPQRKGEGKKKI